MGGVVGNVEALKEEILKLARSQADEMVERATKVSERDLVYARQEAEEIISQQKAKVQPLVEIEKKKILVTAQMKARRMLLEKKDELVSRIFAEAETALEKMRGSGEYLDTIVRLLKEGITVIGTEAVVEYGEKDREIFVPKVIASLKQSLEKSLGKKLNLEFRNVSDAIPSGIIIRSKDGKMIVDCSFPNLFERLREELRSEVSDMLLQE